MRESETDDSLFPEFCDKCQFYGVQTKNNQVVFYGSFAIWEVQFSQTSISKKSDFFSQVSAKPKIGTRCYILTASELWVGIIVEAKVVFPFYRSRLYLEVTIILVAVQVKDSFAGFWLPPLCSAFCACVTTHINVLHGNASSVLVKGKRIERR